MIIWMRCEGADWIKVLSPVLVEMVDFFCEKCTLFFAEVGIVSIPYYVTQVTPEVVLVVHLMEGWFDLHAWAR